MAGSQKLSTNFSLLGTPSTAFQIVRYMLSIVWYLINLLVPQGNLSTKTIKLHKSPPPKMWVTVTAAWQTI